MLEAELVQINDLFNKENHYIANKSKEAGGKKLEKTQTIQKTLGMS